MASLDKTASQGFDKKGTAGRYRCLIFFAIWVVTQTKRRFVTCKPHAI